MLNFDELSTAVAKIVQRAGDSSYKTDIGTWVNMSLQYLYNIYDYYPDLQDVYNFTTVASTGDYFMPNHFGKPMRIYDLTNNKKLMIITDEEFTDANLYNIANSTTGTPDKARMYGVLGVKKQISSSGATTKISGSAAGDQGTIVRVEGYLDSSMTILGFENITLGTPSTATVAGTTTFYKITHVSKSQDTTGYVTLQDSSSNTLAVLAQTDRVLRHRVMKLGLIPDAANSMRVFLKRRFTKLVNSYDYPFVDADDFIIVNSSAYALEQGKETVDRSAQLWSKANELLKAILTDQASSMGPDFQHKMVSSFAQAHRR